MGFDGLAGFDRVVRCAASLAFAGFAFVASQAHAQGITVDLVVTSPQAWAPQGSLPPHGVRLEPGASAFFSMRFENRRESVLQRMLVIARLGGDFSDPRSQYRFSDPIGPVECGEFIPFTFTGARGYGIPIGPLEPRGAVECSWWVERLSVPDVQNQMDLQLSVGNGGDCLFTPSAPNSRCIGPVIHFGNLPDLSMHVVQVAPIEPGVSREARVRMTVNNPTGHSIRPRAYGQCLIQTDLGFRNDFPGACPRVSSVGSCLNGTGAYFGFDTVPARSSRSCELIVTTRTSFRNRQLIAFNPLQGSYLRRADGAWVLDPNPGNEQTVLELGDPPLPVDLFADGRRAMLWVLVAILLYAGIASLHRLT